MIEADDLRVCGPYKAEYAPWISIHPLVAEEYEMHGIGKSLMTQRDYDAIYEAQAQRADEPTAEVSAKFSSPIEGVLRAATEDDYFAEFERMRATIAELSRRPTMEQYLAVCESAARITKAFEMMADTAKQLQAEYDALSGRVLPRQSAGFPANALRHSV